MPRPSIGHSCRSPERRSRRESCRDYLLRMCERIRHPRDAKSKLSRCFRWNVIQILTTIFHLRAEMTGHQCVQALETSRPEFAAANNSKSKSIQRLLNDLELNDPRHL